MSTYRSIDRFIALQAAVFPKTVMGLAKRHARDAASYSAKVNRAEAAEEAIMPRLGSLGMRLGVDVFTRTGENVIETVLPLVEVVVVNRTIIVGVGLTRHFGDM